MKTGGVIKGGYGGHVGKGGCFGGQGIQKARERESDGRRQKKVVDLDGKYHKVLESSDVEKLFNISKI